MKKKLLSRKLIFRALLMLSLLPVSLSATKVARDGYGKFEYCITLMGDE